MTNLALIFTLVSVSAFAHQEKQPPHLDLEMTSAEYALHLKTVSTQVGAKNNTINEDPAIGYAINIGTRLSTWIAKINASRTPETVIRLTSDITRSGGIPIDKPSIYSPSLIKERLAEALSKCPAEMKTIIIGTQELPTTIPVADDVFIKAARLLDRQYQSAARFRSVDRWRSTYTSRAKQDVRGFHYLKTNSITEKELSNVSALPAGKIPVIKDALVKICFNARGTTIESCTRELNLAFNFSTVSDFYNKYFKRAETIWKNFFVIPIYGVRNDIDWHGMTAIVPFNTPSIAKFTPYLQTNIEDEFRWNGWGLKIKFGPFVNGPTLVFQPGVVPHVNGLGGNQIVMDSNQSIEEYASQWIIRHEFGHVLGLPDCYHEFYDADLKAYVNYQLDTTDLMCSRAGNMNERIYQELKQAYDI